MRFTGAVNRAPEVRAGKRSCGNFSPFQNANFWAILKGAFALHGFQPAEEGDRKAKMDSGRILRLSMDELRWRMRMTDPAALIVPARILRRVIKESCRITSFAFRVPHQKNFFVSREAALSIADYDELGLREGCELPETLILLAEPSLSQLESATPEEILGEYWRMLFHARLHLAVRRNFILGFLSPSVVQKRIHEIGETAFDEVRSVLQQENMLLPPRDDATIYEEFAAVFFERRYFSPSQLARSFPGLGAWDAVTEIVGRDVEADKIFKATRPMGAVDPSEHEAVEDDAAWFLTDDGPERPALRQVEPSEAEFQRYVRKAQRPSAAGNVVRSLINHAKALRYAPPDFLPRIRSAVKNDVNRLIARLHAALELPEQEPHSWHESLLALVKFSATGYWTPEARLLYDLQKICLDHERDVYRLDVYRWAQSFGREPLKRRVVNRRELLLSQRLQSARGKLAATRISDERRLTLASLLDDAIERVESAARDRFRPKIVEALDASGLTPANAPERIARDKLIEELLDQAVKSGYLSLGDLRDAISRSNMKLPDLHGWSDVVLGDMLLRANVLMGEKLDGVYRPAEFYLRWMQRISSLGFGTNNGRLFTRFVAVPFGGAYMILLGLYHLVHMIYGDVHGLEMPIVIFSLGAFLCGLVNSAGFRRGVWSGTKFGCAKFREFVFEPVWNFVRSDWVQKILHDRWFLATMRYVAKPAVFTWIGLLVFAKGDAGRASLISVAEIFLALNLLLNSKPGRVLEEIAADWALQNWRRYGWRMIVGIFWAVFDFFRGVVEGIERLTYSVDEWLRFKSGDGEWALPAKAVFGTLWAGVAYVVRFCVTLLIEPQINPIKHFPVVTVSHKMLLPLIPAFKTVLVQSTHMEGEFAWTIASAIIFCTPGVFGFLVWELKENWRLYEANRYKNLHPSPVGGHGETMSRLLKPGFHSGTIPKLYAKLRSADRKARRTGQWGPVRKNLAALHHVEESVRRFVERDLLKYFEMSDRSVRYDLRLHRIYLTSNVISLEIGCGEDKEMAEALIVRFECVGGVFAACAAQAGWAERLPDERREAISRALLGFYLSCGVEAVRQQIEAALPSPLPCYDLDKNGIVVWLDRHFESKAIYEFGEDEMAEPKLIFGSWNGSLKPRKLSELSFREFALSWDEWTRTWRGPKEASGETNLTPLPFPVLSPKRETKT